MLSNSDGTPSALSSGTAFDAFGRLRISEPFTLFDSSFRYNSNGGDWNTNESGSSNVVFNLDQGLCELQIGSSSGDEVIRETNRAFSYQPGKSLLILSTFVFDQAKTGLRQRVGYFGSSNGLFLEQENETISFVKRTAISGQIENIKVNQSSWNMDKLDGTGSSGYTLDLTKAQILWMDVEWLGVGSVRMGFVIDGKFIHCHTFHHTNRIQSTYITTASLPVRYEISNVGNTSGESKLKQICSSVISEGGYQLYGKQHQVHIPLDAPKELTAANTYYPVIAIRLKSTHLDSIVIPSGLHLTGLDNAAIYHWLLLEGGTVTDGNGDQWQSINAESSVEYKIDGTGINGSYRELEGGYITITNQSAGTVDVFKDELFKYQLKRNSFTNTATTLILAVAASTGSDIYATMSWQEIN